MKLSTFALALILTATGVSSSQAGFLDITTLTPGSSGSFEGLLDGIAVSGSITTTTPNFQISATGTTLEASTTDGSSPQYSFNTIYTASVPLTDRVGYTSGASTLNSATITITFAAPIVDPTFHVANLDGMLYNFDSTPGLSGLVLLSGNGGGGDGLVVNANNIADANTTTNLDVDPATQPSTTGARSAYGSVQLTGTFSTLVINVSNPGLRGDGGSFTLSTLNAVPEPSAAALSLLLAAAGLIPAARRLRRKAS